MNGVHPCHIVAKGSPHDFCLVVAEHTQTLGRLNTNPGNNGKTVPVNPIQTSDVTLLNSLIVGRLGL